MTKQKQSSTRVTLPGLTPEQKKVVDEAMEFMRRGGKPNPVFETKQWRDKMRSSEPCLDDEAEQE